MHPEAAKFSAFPGTKLGAEFGRYDLGMEGECEQTIRCSVARQNLPSGHQTSKVTSKDYECNCSVAFRVSPGRDKEEGGRSDICHGTLTHMSTSYSLNIGRRPSRKQWT